MVDPRGGAFTLGLGLVENMTIVPHHDNWSEDKAHRTLQLAPKGLIVVGVDERTALVRDPDGGWRAEGAGTADRVAGWNRVVTGRSTLTGPGSKSRANPHQ